MKHNMHHALTNEVGYDEYVALEPALYLWRPDPKNDSPLRKYQHWYWPLPFSILFLYWRFDSWKYVLQHKEWGQAARLAAHYAVYLSLFPLKTFFFAIWLSGLLTATVVTVTHQSEEMFLGDSLRKYDFVEAQFRSTRDAKLSNWFSSILWGGAHARHAATSALQRPQLSHPTYPRSAGMEWQLEHHLFPTMPRYRYEKLAPVLKAFADENNLDYRVSGEWEIIKQNVDLLQTLSTAEPQPGNPDSTPIFKQI